MKLSAISLVLAGLGACAPLQSETNNVLSAQEQQQGHTKRDIAGKPGHSNPRALLMKRVDSAGKDSGGATEPDPSWAPDWSRSPNKVTSPEPAWYPDWLEQGRSKDAPEEYEMATLNKAGKGSGPVKKLPPIPEGEALGRTSEPGNTARPATSDQPQNNEGTKGGLLDKTKNLMKGKGFTNEPAEKKKKPELGGKFDQPMVGDWQTGYRNIYIWQVYVAKNAVGEKNIPDAWISDAGGYLPAMVVGTPVGPGGNPAKDEGKRFLYYMAPDPETKKLRVVQEEYKGSRLSKLVQNYVFPFYGHTIHREFFSEEPGFDKEKVKKTIEKIVDSKEYDAKTFNAQTFLDFAYETVARGTTGRKLALMYKAESKRTSEPTPGPTGGSSPASAPGPASVPDPASAPDPDNAPGPANAPSPASASKPAKASRSTRASSSTDTSTQY